MDKKIAKAYFQEVADKISGMQDELMDRLGYFVDELDPTAFALLENLAMSKALALACIEELDASTH